MKKAMTNIMHFMKNRLSVSGMSGRKKLLAGFLVVAIVAAAGVAAVRIGIGEAHADHRDMMRMRSAITHSPFDQMRMERGESERYTRIAAAVAQARGDRQSFDYIPSNRQGDKDDEQKERGDHPYVGIYLAPVEDGSGAMIVKVAEDSPADGSLQMDDIITAIDGEAVGEPRDAVRIVREHSPGDSVIFSITRSGSGMDVAITIGEGSDAIHKAGRRKHGRYGGHYHGLMMGADRHLVLSDNRYMTDDGVKTIRKAMGTVQNINAGAGTFDLVLRDESGTLSFTIDEDTKIVSDSMVSGDMEGEASLSNLNADTITMVVEVTHSDGARQVQFVAQGDFSVMLHSMLGEHGLDMMKHRMDMMPHMDRQGQGRPSLGRFFQWRGGHDSENKQSESKPGENEDDA